MNDEVEHSVTWRELLADTVAQLGDRQHARWMCEAASSTSPEEFAASLDHAATVRMVSHLDQMINRYRAGEPLQYVLGRWGFRRLDLLVDQRVLIPRPETEDVVEAALAVAREVRAPRVVVDLGTGSGAIGLAMADELPYEGTTVWITDASADALDVARSNLAGIGRSARNVRVAQGSWFEALPDEVVADVIVANPPYVAVGSPDVEPSVDQWEPRQALYAGQCGLDDITKIIDEAPNRLRQGGWLILEIGADQGEATLALLGRAGFVDVGIDHDSAGRDRIARGRTP